MILSNQFYFTKIDPDYSIKGSRDPLGFQVLWQHQARQLLPFLSTVSQNVQDFQIMCLAYYLYGKQPDNSFVSYFLRFEQLMAYTRYENGVGGFNGVDRVRKRMVESNRFSISNSPEDQILSNQRAYGIWGKYNRPFQDINFLKDLRFEQVFSKKLDVLADKAFIEKVIQNLITKDRLRVDLDTFEIIRPLLNITAEEKGFFRDKILKVYSANPYQNQLFHYLEANVLPEEFNFYAFLHDFKSSKYASDENLQLILSEIEATEKLLAPLNRIFRYLQTRPLWSRSDLEDSTFLNQCKQTTSSVFSTTNEENKLKNELSLAIQKNNWGLVEFLVKRNTEVSTWRGGVPWLTINDHVLEVHHSDGGFYDSRFDPMLDVDNFYFIDTYLNLFHQLK